MQSYKIYPYFSKNKYEMTEEREIAGFVLPLAAGIALCNTFSDKFIQHWLSFLSLSLIGLCMVLAHIYKGKNKIQIVLCIYMAFFLGIFCMSTCKSQIPETVKNTSLSIVWIQDKLPFKNETTSGIISAFITGDKSGLDKSTKDIFRKSGASHLLALSGLHLGMIYLIIQKTLAILGKSIFARWIRYILLVLSTGLYTYLTGASPSLVRAFLFILLRETSILVCRPQASGQILMAALTIQLLIKPSSLFSLGFQLSYLAVLGITYIYPRLKRCWQEDPNERTSWMGRLWNSACLVISCQITTAPLAWIKFGSFPSHFLIANILAIPLAGIIMPMALLCITLNCIGFCPEVIVDMTERMTSALLNILSIISHM